MSDDLVQIARSRIDGAQRTHWEGCERDHRECLIQRMADEIERLRATLERQQLSYEREREIDQEEIERLLAQRRGDANALRMIADALGVPEDARHDGGIMRAITKLAEAEVLAEYGRDDGRRDWVNVGTWLYPGYRIVVQGLPPQVTNAHGHVLTTAALWKMYVEDPETPDEPRAG